MLSRRASLDPGEQSRRSGPHGGATRGRGGPALAARARVRAEVGG